MKRTFLESFAKDPSQFIQTWLESQSRDLESILGNGPMEGLTIRQEELRRSEFFQLPWVEEVRYYKCFIYCINLKKMFFLCLLGCGHSGRRSTCGQSDDMIDRYPHWQLFILL
jgi:hypothetical protein